ncbi:MAG: hypothetical protein HQ522_07955 [Bacteroidetes bacterium]|nr:hypothetical protein [Bacteroidota bacterium]
MNLDKIKQVNEELAQLPSITEKLNHWKTNYFYKYEGRLHEYFDLKTAEENGNGYNDLLSGPLEIPITQDKLVPELHSPSFGVPKKQRIEYYRWMLFFLAEERFKHYTKTALQEKFSTPLGKEKLRGRLNKIKQIQNNAKQALADGTIDIRFSQYPTNEELYLWCADDYYSRIEIPISNMENAYVISVCEHLHVFPFLKELLSYSKETPKAELLKLIGIDIKKLVSDLITRKYISKDDETRMINWFKGIIPSESIHINKPMNHFASLIANLQEENYIKNKKTFCKNLINSTLLFNNNSSSKDSIKNALNENALTRIYENDSINYIDILDFTLKT